MKTTFIVAALFISTTFFSCKKYLDAKPDATLATPSSLQDLQELMDYYGINTQFPNGTEILADNYYLSYTDWQAIRRINQRDYYIWQPDANNDQEWNQPYTNIFNCNLALESLPKITYDSSQVTEANNIKGTALFIRASYFYSLAQLFAKAYNKSSATADPGIPLRLTTDFSEKTTRPSVEDSYTQIINDFKRSVQLLPVRQSIKTRPSKAAAYGAVARTYLAMEDYTNAGLYADSCLGLYNTLIDYNTLDSNSSIPFTRFNEEVIFQATSFAVDPVDPRISKIDTVLYRSYDDNDLRKVVCFKINNDGSIAFKGDYDGSADDGYGRSFTGITSDEQYLIKAECEARQNNSPGALNDLNALLVNRWRTGTFVPYTITDTAQLLTVILDERRKELPFRTLRLTDLKRLNMEAGRQVTLYRNLNGITYTLPPNDDRYVEQIPKTVIAITRIRQNP